VDAIGQVKGAGGSRGDGSVYRNGIEVVQVNVEVPKPLRAQWKHAALDREMTVTELVIAAMAKYLQDRK